MALSIVQRHLQNNSSDSLNLALVVYECIRLDSEPKSLIF